jgi:hypothetical protein
MPVHAITLKKGAFVPVETQPAKSAQNNLGMLGAGSGSVGILDTEDKHASVVPREQPVEESRAGTPNVKISRGRGSESNAYCHILQWFMNVGLKLFI